MSASRIGLPDTELCSVYSAAVGEQAIGSASDFTHLLALEIAPPWPRDAFKSLHLDPAVRAALDSATTRWPTLRLQALYPHPDRSRDGFTHLLYYRLTDGELTYTGTSYLVPPTELPALITALTSPVANLIPFESFRQPTPTRELLVCTHGSRDTCCGTFGYPVYDWLNAHASEIPGLRIWRTSHTGGHRFAPTAIDLPSGRTWGRLTEAHLPKLLHQPDHPSLHACDRGLAALPAFGQIAAAAVWKQRGSYPRIVRAQLPGPEDTFDNPRITLTVLGATGEETVTVAISLSQTVRVLKSSGLGQLESIPQYTAEIVAD